MYHSKQGCVSAIQAIIINVCRRLGLYTLLMLPVNPNYPITVATLETIQEERFQLLPQAPSKYCCAAILGFCEPA